MAILINVPSQNYSATTSTPRKVALPQPLNPAVQSIRLRLTRENWSAGNPLISMGFEYSPDGNTWANIGSATFVGGDFLGRDGQPVPESTVTVNVPNVGVSGRRIRTFVENFATLTTAITVETV